MYDNIETEILNLMSNCKIFIILIITIIIKSTTGMLSDDGGVTLLCVES